MNFIENPNVLTVFNQYPAPLRQKLLLLRQLLLETAAGLADDNELQETLKWGEPAYQTKNGSTLRMAWKKSAPQQFALYFHCKTKLVDTFRELYHDVLCFEGNRAIVFNKNDVIPVDEIKHCILLSLTYHKIKHLPLLGT
ncbi:FIG01062417: hypothetical protein [hydrothermal vent metagenome]|uniref:YdhG-like domain-containing protein n=1 Tax=hydrothermal vent metagenome TaxID=652676 RepID=A0A3B0XJT7_9ZZZZ